MDPRALDHLLLQLPVVVAVLRGPELSFEYASPRLRQLVSDRLLYGRPLREAVPEVVGQGVPDVAEHVLRTGEPVHMAEAAVEVHGPQGRERVTLTWSVHPYRNGNGTMDGVIAFGVDVTETARERRRAEETAALLDALLAQCPLGIGFFDRALRFVKVNPALTSIDGLSPEAHVGRTVAEVSPELAPQVVAQLERVVEERRTVQHVLQSEPGDDGNGRHEWKVVYYPVQRRGHLIGAGAICEDVTEDRQQARERADLVEELRTTADALATSERELRVLADSIPQLVWQTDGEGVPRWVNRRWVAYTGLEVEDLGRFDTDAWRRALHPEDRERVIRTWTACLEDGAPFDCEYRLRSREGHWRWFLARAAAYRDEAGEVVGWFGTHTDVHDQQVAAAERERLTAEAQEARAAAEESERRYRALAESIRANEERLRMAVDAAEVGTWDHDPQGGGTVWDGRCKEIFGVPPSGDVSWDTLLAGLHPGDRLQVQEALARAYDPKGGGLFDAQYRTVGLLDGAQRAVRARGRVYFDRSRQPVRFLGTLRDVTAEVEVRAAEERHARFRETFLAVLGHDLRGPLGAIRMTAAALLNQEDPSSERAPMLRRVVVSAERMATMIRQLLDMTRVRLAGGITLEARDVDLREICQRVVDEVRTAEPEASIELACDGDLSGHWDPDRLEQVVANLVSNAVAHGEGTVSVIASGADGDVHVYVHNRGRPIPEELMPGLFDPFTRVRKPSKGASGLGLGLFISRQIALAHGGDVGVRSTEEAGTTFTLTLPRRS